MQSWQDLLNDTIEAARCHEAWLAGHFMPTVENIPPGQNIGAVLESRVTTKKAELVEAVEDRLALAHDRGVMEGRRLS